MFKVGESYKLTHEYVGKHYRTFEAILLKAELGKGLTRLTFRDIERNSELYFYYPISKKKRYGIIKVEDK